jgi:hypothetical protein
MLHSEHPGLGSAERRLEQVRREIAESGTYVHTAAELTFGARVAWRNAMSGATTPVFHRYFHEADQRPNFYLDPLARDLARHGRPPAPPPPGAGGFSGSGHRHNSIPTNATATAPTARDPGGR